MAELDVNDAAQVSSPQLIDADLGIGGRRLLIASGIAILGWRIDSDEIHRGEDTVHLRIPADRIEQATIHVGLASIGNDDSEYVFAVDEASLRVNDAGELDLAVKTAVMGEWSSLNRFAYQVVALVARDVAEISGRITWPVGMLRPASANPFAVAGNISVTLHERTTRPSPGPFGGEIESLTPIGVGEITAVSVGDAEAVAQYRILNPKKGVGLKVVVGVTGFAVGAGGSVVVGPAVPGADVFQLSVNAPSRSGVDFIVSAVYVR